jgi:hypothetical protein
MEIIKQIKEEEKSLTDLNLKVIDLNVKNGEDGIFCLMN